MPHGSRWQSRWHRNLAGRPQQNIGTHRQAARTRASRLALSTRTTAPRARTRSMGTKEGSWTKSAFISQGHRGFYNQNLLFCLFAPPPPPPTRELSIPAYGCPNRMATLPSPPAVFRRDPGRRPWTLHDCWMSCNSHVWNLEASRHQSSIGTAVHNHSSYTYMNGVSQTLVVAPPIPSFWQSLFFRKPSPFYSSYSAEDGSDSSYLHFQIGPFTTGLYRQ